MTDDAHLHDLMDRLSELGNAEPHLDDLCCLVSGQLTVMLAIPQYERDLAEGLQFTDVPDGWTLTRHLDDGYGYDEAPEDDEALLSNLTGDVSYRLRPVRDDEGALTVSVRCPRANWQSYPTWDAAVADLVVPIADRIAAIPDGGVQQIDGDWYLRPPGCPRAVSFHQTPWRPMAVVLDGNGAPSLREGGKHAVFRYAAEGVEWRGQLIDGRWVAVNRRQAWQLVDGLWTLVDIPPEARQ